MSFKDELDIEVQRALNDARLDMIRAAEMFPLPPAPPVPWHRRVRRRVRMATQPARAWLARRIYDYVEHEDRW